MCAIVINSVENLIHVKALHFSVFYNTVYLAVLKIPVLHAQGFYISFHYALLYFVIVVHCVCICIITFRKKYSLSKIISFILCIEM